MTQFATLARSSVASWQLILQAIRKRAPVSLRSKLSGYLIDLPEARDLSGLPQGFFPFRVINRPNASCQSRVKPTNSQLTVQQPK
jgi:hypothetical protein